MKDFCLFLKEDTAAIKSGASKGCADSAQHATFGDKVFYIVFYISAILVKRVIDYVTQGEKRKKLEQLSSDKRIFYTFIQIVMARQIHEATIFTSPLGTIGSLAFL